MAAETRMGTSKTNMQTFRNRRRLRIAAVLLVVVAIIVIAAVSWLMYQHWINSKSSSVDNCANNSNADGCTQCDALFLDANGVYKHVCGGSALSSGH